MSSLISDTGISIVYAPDEGDPLLDIVIVHGLQGHPFRTWASHGVPKAGSDPDSSSSGKSKKRKGIHRYSLRRVISKVSTNSSAGAASKEPCCIDPLVENDINKLDPVFWPRDLAPQDCPRSRILVFGYDTKISRYMTGPTNKNHVLSHGKDLLYALSRERTQDRPLVFLAHSLGGIVVKEALAASAVSVDVDLKNIVDSTAAVIFMGTPHRGSPDLSALGEWARSVLSILRMETTSAILDTLGLKTSDLERAQESFSGLWSKYDFRVKTFQESLGLTGIHLGVLGNKVVPDYSSLLGDPRERAESIQANHMDMCRFTGADDPNYRKVAGEFRSIYQSILELNESRLHQNGLIQRQILVSRARNLAQGGSEGIADQIPDIARSFHQKLKFPEMNQRYQSIPKPANGTCSWLFEHEKYLDWLKGRNLDSHEGLLLLRGKPGAGKSVLMKEACRRISLVGPAETVRIVAKFFFHSQHQTLEQSFIDMFRSLLYQLLPLYEKEADLIQRLWDNEDTLSLTTLRNVLECVLCIPQKRRTFLIIDALDECSISPYSTPRSLACLWRDITRTAYESGAQLNVLISMRHFPHITLSNCPVITVDRSNRHDIGLYIVKQFQLVAMPEPYLGDLKDQLVRASRGVFLWAVLTVQRTIENYHEGQRISPETVSKRHASLDELYSRILDPIDVEMKQVTIRLFQWASLAIAPLRLHEWHHIMAFIRQPGLLSLHDWRRSEYFTESDDQLEMLIKSLSRGLLEVRTMTTDTNDGQEMMSMRAGAGSLDHSHGETRVVEFIHHSAQELFRTGDGFSNLRQEGVWNCAATGHLQIMQTCLDYLGIHELDALVEARSRHSRLDNRRGSRSTESSVDQDGHREIQIIKRHNEPEEVYLLPPGAEGHSSERHSLLASFQSLSTSACGIDIDQWVASSQFQIQQGTFENSKSASAVYSSKGTPTQILQDHPALLSYVTNRFFWHARQAQLAGANPWKIVIRLLEGSWTRWLLLNEKFSPALQLHDFVKKQRLESWYPSITKYMINVKGKDPGLDFRGFRTNGFAYGSSRKSNWCESAPSSETSETSSVESFGSAGSHRSIKRWKGSDI